MSNEQLWLAIGAQLFFNGLIFLLILTNMNARFASIETRLASLDQRVELLTGAIHDLDNSITRLEEHRR
jgi:hypothetical protein